MRPGVRLGIDVGLARIGVARSDIHGMLSTPVETVARAQKPLDRLLALIGELEVVEVVVGHPLSLSGEATPSTEDAVRFAGELARRAGVPVRLVDERLSTVAAQRSLQQAGRNTRSSRPVIDQVAATIILQHALDSERSGGNPPGELIIQDEG
jgi:putative Holliday junction resolvase